MTHLEGDREVGGTQFRDWLRGLRPPPHLSREDAASRASAYVYGNVLVMAALISLRTDDLLGPSGVLYVLGMGISTFVAHMVGHGAGRRIRQGRSIQWADVRHEIRDTLPIVTATIVPSSVLLLAWGGPVDATLVQVLAIAVTDLRLALVGFVVERFSGERSSAKAFLAGIGLAVVSAAVAVLKWWLTH